MKEESLGSERVTAASFELLAVFIITKLGSLQT